MTAAVLTWHQSQPRTELAAAFELPGITDRGNQSGCNQRAYALHFDQAPATLVLLTEPRYALVVAPEIIVECTQSLGHLADQFAHQRTQIIGFVLEDQWQGRAQPPDCLGNYNSTLTQQTSDLVGQCGAVFYELFTHPGSACMSWSSSRLMGKTH